MENVRKLNTIVVVLCVLLSICLSGIAYYVAFGVAVLWTIATQVYQSRLYSKYPIVWGKVVEVESITADRAILSIQFDYNNEVFVIYHDIDSSHEYYKVGNKIEIRVDNEFPGYSEVKEDFVYSIIQLVITLLFMLLIGILKYRHIV